MVEIIRRGPGTFCVIAAALCAVAGVSSGATPENRVVKQTATDSGRARPGPVRTIGAGETPRSTPTAENSWTPSIAENPPRGIDANGAARLVVLEGDQKSAARSVIAALAVKGRGPKTGYSRAAFGQAWTDDAGSVLWSHNGCGTRDDVLARDLDGPRKRNACVVTGGTFVDPYTNSLQLFEKAHAERWPVDHVVPLAYAWVMGAREWSMERRIELANDPLNVVVTTTSVNSAKGDSSPASYLPPNKTIRCAYALRFALVAKKYKMPVTATDRDVMVDQCR